MQRKLYPRFSLALDGMREDRRSGRARRKIALCGTEPDLAESDYLAVVQGVRLMLENLGIQSLDISKGVAPFHPQEGFAATRISSDVKDEVDSYRVFISKRRMLFLEGDQKEIYGTALYPNVFISLRLPDLRNVPKERAVALLAAHEIGHLLGGLATRNFNCEDSHCRGENGPCVMRKKFPDIIQTTGDHLLCPDCTTHAEKNREYLEEEGIYL